jgi:hypothetical protein
MTQARKHSRPADFDAAMADAIRFLGYCRRHGWLPGEQQARVSTFQPAHDPNELRDFYEKDLAELFKLARQGDVEADQVLRQSILDDVKNGLLTRQKFKALSWLLLARRSEPPAAQGRQELKDRNFLIATVIFRITAFGFTPTRNRARTASSISACQIAAMALEKIGMPMTERAIEEVWGDNKQAVEKCGFVPLE